MMARTVRLYVEVLLGLVVGLAGCSGDHDIVSPSFGQRVNVSYERAGSNETVTLGDGVFTENGFVITSDKINLTLDAFVFAEGWYLIHGPEDLPSLGCKAGWILAQDSDDTPDGIAEFRAVCLVPPNQKLDFSKSGNATFFLDIIDGTFISKEDVMCKWTMGK